ncbi:MAG: hypothetical protein WBA45_01885 [Microthrixaceae bacterium]
MINEVEPRRTLLGWLDAQQQAELIRPDDDIDGSTADDDPITKTRGESPVQLSGPRREGPETRNRGEAPDGMRWSGQRREGPLTHVRGEFE